MRKFVWLFVFCFAVGLALVQARDFGQWTNEDPHLREWYAHLKMPDAPSVSCCGEGDAYYCDDVHVDKGHTYCLITDDRPDKNRVRAHIPLGTRIDIPDSKINRDPNPTGHVVVFLGWYGYNNANGTPAYSVYCFILNGGV